MSNFKPDMSDDDSGYFAAQQFDTIRQQADNARLLADKDVQRSQARNGSYEASIKELEAEVERLTAALQAIIRVHDRGYPVYPSDVVMRSARNALEQSSQEQTGKTTFGVGLVTHTHTPKQGDVVKLTLREDEQEAPATEKWPGAIPGGRLPPEQS